MKPVNFWFKYPIHWADKAETLKVLPSQGSFEAGKLKCRFHKSTDQANEEFRKAWHALNLDNNGVSVEDMAAYLGLSHRTIRNRVQCMKDEFLLEDGRIYEAEPEDDPESDLTGD